MHSVIAGQTELNEARMWAGNRHHMNSEIRVLSRDLASYIDFIFQTECVIIIFKVLILGIALFII